MPLTKRQDKALKIALAVVLAIGAALIAEAAGVRNGPVLVFRVAMIAVIVLEGAAFMRRQLHREHDDDSPRL